MQVGECVSPAKHLKQFVARTICGLTKASGTQDVQKKMLSSVNGHMFTIMTSTCVCISSARQYKRPVEILITKHSLKAINYVIITLSSTVLTRPVNVGHP